MKRKSQEDSLCPVARALDVLGDWWSLLIIRDAFDGISRFSEFQKNLGMAKNILSTRLRALVAQGILQVSPAADGSAYQEYLLTNKGCEIFPIIVALRQWGEDHQFAPGEKHSRLVDNDNGQPIPRMTPTGHSGQKLTLTNTRVVKVGDDSDKLPHGESDKEADKA